MRILRILAACAALLSFSGGLASAEEAWFSRIDWDKNADRMEARFGVMAYDTGAFSPKQQSGVVIHGEFLLPSPEFLRFLGSPRPYVGVDFAPKAQQTDFIYAGLNWEAYLTERLYLTGSLGGAVHNARNLINPVGYKALGCRTLFHLGAGVGFDFTRDMTVQLYADHFSNADLCRQNAGQEAAGVRFGYRF